MKTNVAIHTKIKTLVDTRVFFTALVVQKILLCNEYNKKKVHRNEPLLTKRINVIACESTLYKTDAENVFPVLLTFN